MNREQPTPDEPDRIVTAEALIAHRPVLLAAARAITLDAAEAEDLVQATFEIALRHGDQLRAPGALQSWLLTVETREAFRWRRRFRRLVRLDGVAEPAAPASVDPEQIVVRQALGRLPRRMRAAVVLHHMAGLSVAETAVALGSSPNTIKTQLRTGLARLREDLGDG